MTHRAPADGTANMRQRYKDPDGRESVVHYPDLSAKHADEAVDSLVQSRRTDLDSRERERLANEALVFAILSHRDKLDEVHATIKHCTTQVLDSQETLATAARHLYKDAKEIKAQLHVIQGEAA